LTWKMVDGDTLAIPATITKNGLARVLPLTGELGEIIERRRAARQVEANGTAVLADLIFHKDGHPVGQFQKEWDRATKAANCEGKLFHDLRRSACRSMIQAGVPIQIAKKISGHKIDSMFQRYAILDVNDLAKGLEQTETFRKSAATKSKVVSMR
jgi:integrase